VVTSQEKLTNRPNQLLTFDYRQRSPIISISLRIGAKATGSEAVPFLLTQPLLDQFLTAAAAMAS
jgi:hypothetical protein